MSLPCSSCYSTDMLSALTSFGLVPSLCCLPLANAYVLWYRHTRVSIRIRHPIYATNTASTAVGPTTFSFVATMASSDSDVPLVAADSPPPSAPPPKRRRRLRGETQSEAMMVALVASDNARVARWIQPDVLEKAGLQLPLACPLPERLAWLEEPWCPGS